MQQAFSRNSRLDTVKCILIFCVVFGHTISNLATRDIWNGDILGVIYKFIYTFHMPLFTMITGYLFTVKDSRSLLRSSLNLFVTYVIFDIAYMIYLRDFDILSILYSPRWILWYLYCIPFWKGMTTLANNRIDVKLLLLLSVVLSLLCNLVCFRTTQFLFGFYPFFLIGYLFRNRHPQVLSMKSVVLPVIVLTGVFLLTKFGVVDVVSSVYTEYKYTADNVILGMLQKLFALAVMLISSLSVYLLISNGGGYLSNIGQNTLAIYLLHGFMIIPVGFAMRHVLGQYNLFWCFVYSVLIMAASYFLGKFKIVQHILSFYSYVETKIEQEKKNRL